MEKIKENIKCKFFPQALCLTDDVTKCKDEYNKFNDECPYFKIPK